MEFIAVVRILWRRRRMVVVGLFVACLLAVVGARSAVPATGAAEAGVVVDTTRSQLVSDAPKGADTLWWRATLLAMLLGSESERQRMAQESGIPGNHLIVNDVELMAPTIPASLPSAATTAANATAADYTLTVKTDNVLPIISIAVSAPDKAAAGRLAAAAVHALQADGQPGDTEELQGLSIEPVGPVKAKVIPGGSGHMKMAMAAAFLFCLWCAGLLAGPLLRGARRTFVELRAAEA